jgi:CDGSH-type Zn-finger protein
MSEIVNPGVKIADYKSAKIELEAGKTYSWCSCGHSKNQPFCDGSHRKTMPEGYKSLKFTAEKDGVRGLCLCKHTKNPPYCDGSHRSLPQPTTVDLSAPTPAPKEAKSSQPAPAPISMADIKLDPRFDCPQRIISIAEDGQAFDLDEQAVESIFSQVCVLLQMLCYMCCALRAVLSTAVH